MSVTEEMIQAYREQVAPYLYVTPQTPLTNPESSTSWIRSPASTWTMPSIWIPTSAKWISG